MFEYFYNEVFRSVIIGFGSLFNGIEIRHKDESDNTYSTIQVPLAYGPTQKFLARMQQEADLNKPIQMTLPRMSFEFTGLQYDPERKTTKTQSFVTVGEDGTSFKKVYSPVPYNMTIVLSIYTKLNDDMLQIIEQILPFFQPAYNLPIKFLGNLNEIKDVPINLDQIQMDDDYEGNFDTRRALIYTLTFTAKTYLYGPVSDVTGDVIKKVTVGYLAGKPGEVAVRNLAYQVTPRATKDYDGSVVTNLTDNVDMISDMIPVGNTSSIPPKTYIYIGSEEMYVESIVGSSLRVKRGQDKTSAQNHLKGAQVMTITAADDKLIEFGDDFGFSAQLF